MTPKLWSFTVGATTRHYEHVVADTMNGAIAAFKDRYPRSEVQAVTLVDGDVLVAPAAGCICDVTAGCPTHAPRSGGGAA